MTKGEKRELYKAKRQKIRKDFEAALKRKDSDSKFQELIRLTKEFEKVTTDMNLDGIAAKVHPEKMQSSIWVKAYEDYMHGTHEGTTVKKSKKSVTISDQQLYNILLCWTIKHDYCVCDSIIETLQNYFMSIGLITDGTTKTSFPDRTEFCQTFKLTGTKEYFDLIIKSAEYILDITTVSAYEKCNIGIFGKEIGK